MHHGDFTDNQNYVLLSTPSEFTRFFLKSFVGYTQVLQSFPVMLERHEKVFLVVSQEEVVIMVALKYPGIAVSESGFLQNFDYKKYSDYCF